MSQINQTASAFMILPFLIFVIIPAPSEIRIRGIEIGIGVIDAMVFHEIEHIVLRYAPMPAGCFMGRDKALFSPVDYREPAYMTVF